MSRNYQPKNKEFAKVKVVSTEFYNKYKKNLKLVGSVQRGYTAFVTTPVNKKTGFCKFIDDTSSLTKKTKNEVVKFFSNKENKKKSVAYLVTEKNN